MTIGHALGQTPQDARKAAQQFAVGRDPGAERKAARQTSKIAMAPVRDRNGFAIGRRGQRAASQSDALLLLDPGIGRGLGEAGDGENDPGCSVKDRARDTLPRWLAAHDPR